MVSKGEKWWRGSASQKQLDCCCYELTKKKKKNVDAVFVIRLVINMTEKRNGQNRNNKITHKEEEESDLIIKCLKNKIPSKSTHKIITQIICRHTSDGRIGPLSFTIIKWKHCFVFPLFYSNVFDWLMCLHCLIWSNKSHMLGHEVAPALSVRQPLRHYFLHNTQYVFMFTI